VRHGCYCGLQVQTKGKSRLNLSGFQISFLIAAIVTSLGLVYLAIGSEAGSGMAADDYVMAPLLVVVWCLPPYSYLVKRMKGLTTRSEYAPSPPAVKGNTLRAYLYIVKKGPCEFKDVQHELGLSTSSLASYHLNKLMENGYVAQDEYGRYFSTKDRSTELLEGYLRINKSLVPQLFLLAIIFSVLVAYFSISITTEPGDQYYLIATAVSAVIVLWFEALKFWKRLFNM
jgi:hypothetical protein